MKPLMPSDQDVHELLSFLPKLYSKDFITINRCDITEKNQDSSSILQWSEYNELVKEFYRLASKKCWDDYKYHPERARKMLENMEVVERASLSQIKTMLTYCVRGERFCDGHWGNMIEKGYIRALLKRLCNLRKDNAKQVVLQKPVKNR